MAWTEQKLAHLEKMRTKITRSIERTHPGKLERLRKCAQRRLRAEIVQLMCCRVQIRELVEVIREDVKLWRRLPACGCGACRRCVHRALVARCRWRSRRAGELFMEGVPRSSWPAWARKIRIRLPKEEDGEQAGAEPTLVSRRAAAGG